MVTAQVEYAVVPRSWPDETCVVLASGPSLCAEDVDYCRGRARVIAVKDAIQLAPWADCLYGCGLDMSQWWRHMGDAVTVPGRLQYTLDPAAAQWAQVLRNTGEVGIETDPSGLRTGKNSGAQAIGLAVHFGATKIVLLGFDCGHTPHQDKYFFGNRQRLPQVQSPFAAFLLLFAAMVEPLHALGVRVINASRVSAITCFERVSLREALS